MNAWDRIAALCGNPEWRFPEDVEASVREALRTRDEELARLRAIIEGRVEPPTGEELDVHLTQHGGRWLVTPIMHDAKGKKNRLPNVPRACFDLLGPEVLGEDVFAALRCDVIEKRTRPHRFIPLDVNGRPCAWPVVKP